jgi:hypothetical protein
MQENSFWRDHNGWWKQFTKKTAAGEATEADWA